MKHLSLLIFVASFCIALVYLSLQSEAAKNGLSAWQSPQDEVQSNSVDNEDVHETAYLQEQVDNLSRKVEEQAEEIQVMQTLISQLSQQTSSSSNKTDAIVQRSALKLETTPVIQNSHLTEKVNNANDSVNDKGSAHKEKREHLARLQDVVSKMEMTSLRALSK